MREKVVRWAGRYWLLAGFAAVLACSGPLIWNAWNQPVAQTDDADAVRTRAVKSIDRTLDDTNQWLTNLPTGPDFDKWLAGFRNEFRPYFNVLSTEFDSQLIFIIREFEAHKDDTGPLRDHSRQIALVSARSLLGEERKRLEDSSIRREDVNTRLIRLPPSALVNGW